MMTRCFVTVLGLGICAQLYSYSQDGAPFRRGVPRVVNKPKAQVKTSLMLRPNVEMLLSEDGSWQIHRAKALTEAHVEKDFTITLNSLTKRRNNAVRYPDGTGKSQVKAMFKLEEHQQAVAGFKVPIEFDVIFVSQGERFSTSGGGRPNEMLEAQMELPSDIEKLQIIFQATYRYTEPSKIIEIDLGTHEILDVVAEFKRFADKAASEEE